MNKYIQILSAFVLIFTIGTYAQPRKLKKADKLFSQYNFAEAAKMYEKLATNTEYAMPASKKLAQCYKQLGQYKAALNWYKKAIELDAKLEPEFIYEYAMMLRSAERYDESISWMARFHDLKANDLRGKAYSSSSNFITKQRKRPAKFSIKNLDINSSNSDFGVSYFGSNVIFTSARIEKSNLKIDRTYVWTNQPFLNIYKATRDKSSGELAEVKLWQKNLESKFHDGPASFTPDLKRVYFTRNNFFKNKKGKSKTGVNNLKIYFSELKDTAYTNIQQLNINNDEYSVGHPCVNADGTKLYFASDMPGGFGGTDIYVADISKDGDIGKPVNMGNIINTEGNEMFPYMHKTGLLFFASNGHVGFGGLDIFVATGKNGNYKKVDNVGEPLNGPMDDFAFIMNDFQTQGYFSSNRDGGKGDDDIYSFKLLRPFENGLLVHGTATDKNSKEILPGSKVSLYTSDGKLIADTLANEEGKYEFEVEYDTDYNVGGTFIDYVDGSNAFSTKDLDDKTELVCDLKLDKVGFTLYGLATDRKTNQPLENVNIIITDANGKEILNLTTDKNGDFNKILSDVKLNDKVEYTINLSKDGYFPKTIKYSKVLNKPGQIPVHTELDFSLDKMEVGVDLLQAFNIEPIYFDLDKSNIREDAAATLDKIVDVLKTYPTMCLELGSHTDCRESKSYNLKLSQRRYESTVKYLAKKVKKGKKRLSGKGYGESQLVNNCPCEPKNQSSCSTQQHQANRRTTFKIKKI